MSIIKNIYFSFAYLYLVNALFLAIMASFLKLFNLLSSCKIWTNKTLNKCNKIDTWELMRVGFTAKKHKTNFILSNTIFDCFKQIIASSRIYFQHWRFFWSFTIDSVWFISHAHMKKKPFHTPVKLTCERKKFTPLWNFKSAWTSLWVRVNTL